MLHIFGHSSDFICNTLSKKNVEQCWWERWAPDLHFNYYLAPTIFRGDKAPWRWPSRQKECPRFSSFSLALRATETKTVSGRCGSSFLGPDVDVLKIVDINQNKASYFHCQLCVLYDRIMLIEV
jgi:hypothetical protein